MMAFVGKISLVCLHSMNFKRSLILSFHKNFQSLKLKDPVWENQVLQYKNFIFCWSNNIKKKSCQQLMNHIGLGCGY